MTDASLPHKPSEILVAEDSPEASSLLFHLLHRHGYVVRQAMDGELALYSVQAKPPDLILLDIRMPIVDGFDVCRRLKADPVTREIPVIFLSGVTEVDAMLKGFHVGAVDYVIKPFNEEEVIARVKTQLELCRLRQQLEDAVQQRTLQLRNEIEERKLTEAKLRASEKQLRDLSGHLEDIREQERARLARELHDELGQALTVLRIDVQRLDDYLLSSQFSRLLFERILNSFDGITQLTRSISENLRPGMLDVLGLSAAIQHHVSQFRDNTGIHCVLKLTPKEFNLKSRIATAVYRIIQESLTNVARHAHASLVDIQIAALESEIIVIIKDNGCGFQRPLSEITGKYGLLGMHERIHNLGGMLDIESVPGKGTRIEASIPFLEDRGLS